MEEREEELRPEKNKVMEIRKHKKEYRKQKVEKI
jgi:hypothetical protein